jgi:hypothetical protein
MCPGLNANISISHAKDKGRVATGGGTGMAEQFLALCARACKHRAVNKCIFEGRHP